MSQDSDETTGVLLPEACRLPSTSLPCLRLLTEEQSGLMVPLTQARTLIGRASYCDVVLRVTGMSREHAEVLRIDRQELWLRDLNSTNGITLNGEPVNQSRLHANDVIGVMGQPLLKVVYQRGWELQLASRVQERASADPLTGAFNDRHLRLRLEEELAIARRKPMKICLLALRPLNIDPDLGSEADRSLLISVTERLEGLLPTEDLLARWEGLSFLALLRGKKQSQAQKIVQRLVENFENQPFPANAERPTSRNVALQWALQEWDSQMDPDSFLQAALKQLVNP